MILKTWDRYCAYVCGFGIMALSFLIKAEDPYNSLVFLILSILLLLIGVIKNVRDDKKTAENSGD